MESKWILLFLTALIADLTDYVGGFVPVAGDLLDLLMALLLGVTAKDLRASAGPLLELVPGADFLPLNFLSVLWSYMHRREED